MLSDVAISAPFTETGSDDPGTVFIYHGTPSLLLGEKPRQVRTCLITNAILLTMVMALFRGQC